MIDLPDIPAEPLSDQQLTELARLKTRYNRVMATGPFNLDDVFPATSDLAILYAQLDDLNRCLDSFRPYNPAQAKNLREVFDTEYTYASNRIEGNSLSLRETALVIHEGLTIGGKTLTDHLEAINHHEAIALVREMAAASSPFTERELKDIHALILHGIDRENAGRYRAVQVGIRGTRIVFPAPLQVPQLMDEYFQDYLVQKDQLHPVALAAMMHERLVNIHPFVDGNGRTSRLVMNLLLLRAGYPITIIQPDEPSRQTYFDALNLARDGNDPAAFERFIAENVKHWCIAYLKMLSPNGGESERAKGLAFFKRIEPHLPPENAPNS